MAFSQLPAYNTGNALNFDPLNQAAQNWGETTRRNALANYTAEQDKIQNTIQQKQESRAQTMFDDKRGQEALNELAGIYQAIETSPEQDRASLYSRVQPMYSRLRQRIPDFDADLQAMGVDPNDHVAVGKLVMGRARGLQSPTEAPSNVREYEYFNRLSPEAKQQYLTMKRSEKYLDLETGYGRPNPITGEVPMVVSKDIAGAAAAKEVGKGAGESQVSLTSLRSKMPGLENVVGQLDKLSEAATYTTAGRVVDAARRELGAEPRESAVARQQYISIVDNQVLPLLRDTFGAAFTQKEGESLRATLGDPNIAPKEKQAVLKAFIEQKRRDVESLSAAAGQTAPPQAGTVMDGYRFRGGNPADPNSWEPAQ